MMFIFFYNLCFFWLVWGEENVCLFYFIRNVVRLELHWDSSWQDWGQLANKNCFIGKTSIKGPRFTLLKFGILIPKNIQKYWVLNILEYWFQIPIEEPNCPIYQTPCIPERNITHVWCKSYSMSIQILISHSILVVL